MHAELSFSDASEVTFDGVLEQLAKVFAGVDSAGGAGDGASVSKLKADYEEMLRSAGVLPAVKPATTVALTRKTARELGGPFNPPDVLAAVREPMGHFNWALFRPSADPVALDFGNAGSLSVPELAKWLRDDEVLCGLLRLGFGVGRFRRVKWVRARGGGGVCWGGVGVSVVRVRCATDRCGRCCREERAVCWAPSVVLGCARLRATSLRFTRAPAWPTPPRRVTMSPSVVAISLQLMVPCPCPHSPPQVYVTWSGPAVGAVKRAKAMSSRAAMRAKLGNASVDVEVSAREDLTLDMVRSSAEQRGRQLASPRPRCWEAAWDVGRRTPSRHAVSTATKPSGVAPPPGRRINVWSRLRCTRPPPPRAIPPPPVFPRPPAHSQIIEKVRRAAIVDGDEVESTSSGDAYSLAAFMEALQEEASASAAYFGDAGLVLQEEAPKPAAPAVPWVERAAADIIAELRRPGAEINWAAFTLAA